MIKIVYYRKYNRVTVTGHALAGEPGHDLVCAGCSAIACTLAANVQQMEMDGYARYAVTKLEPGDAEIACKPKSRYAAIAELIFTSVCVGFEFLAASHPHYISYEIHE